MSVSHDVQKPEALADLTREAAAATHAELSMTLLEGIKTYPYAVGWSVFLSTCIVMEGFDKSLINSLFALTPFKQKYGVQLPDGTYQLTAAWQSGLSNASLVGEICGLWLNGILAEKYGYRKTIIGSLVLVAAFIFLPFFAQSLPQIVAGQVLLGLPWGVFQTITTTYAAEVCPVALRAYLTTYVNLCWVFGQLIAAGVLRGISSRTDEWAFRIPFACQWIWPVPLAIGICFAPDSPWWMIRRDRPEDAKRALQRLTRGANDPKFNVDETVAMMQHTDLLEKTHSSGTSYFDCFKKTDLRRTELACMTWMVQILCGGNFMGYSTYFFENAGLSTEAAFSMSIGLYGLGAVGTISSWFLMAKFGRRSLYIWGQVAMLAALLVIGFLGIISKNNLGAQWAIGSLLLFYTFTYDATIGPVCYSLVTELSSNRLRAKTVVLARIFYNISGLIANFLTPRMLNPSAWGWGAKAGFFWAGSITLCIIWTYFRLPEPKGRTYGELDVLFEQKVSARKFSTTIVNQFGDSQDQSFRTEEKTVAIEKVEAI
ncbi:sugar transporter [Myriangium duriaei CBS 260.36]|uniref:Sugar transporter n=1 Tax=Myriangium duriaei CBS 260.36 TaxID=1168546 RepID=A0A9P4MLU6_9PEZI|nr:sugar transporter [Myriangium duriaei CBS 260.36]